MYEIIKNMQKKGWISGRGNIPEYGEPVNNDRLKTHYKPFSQ